MNVKIGIENDEKVYEKFKRVNDKNIELTIASTKKPLAFKLYSDKLKKENRIRRMNLKSNASSIKKEENTDLVKCFKCNKYHAKDFHFKKFQNNNSNKNIQNSDAIKRLKFKLQEENIKRKRPTSN